MAVKSIIVILELQERKFSFVAGPTDRLSKNWVVLVVLPIAPLSHKPSSSARGVVGTALFAAAADLQVARQISVPEVCAFIVGQQVNRLVYMPQAEGSFVCFQI